MRSRFVDKNDWVCLLSLPCVYVPYLYVLVSTEIRTTMSHIKGLLLSKTLRDGSMWEDDLKTMFPLHLLQPFERLLKQVPYLARFVVRLSPVLYLLLLMSSVSGLSLL
jgi:hypothetical protein